jgi:hypothetical protein
MRASLPRAWVVCFAVLIAPASHAAPCSGFTDVDSSSGFCANVDWMKNRRITDGCSFVPPLYCPNQEVIRVQMAAFMSRLGVRAMTPVVLYNDASGGTLDLDAPPQTLCQTVAFCNSPSCGPFSFPRSLQLTATLTVLTGAQAAGMDLRLVQSTDDGVTWTSLNTFPASVAAANRRANASVVKADVPLSGGMSYIFGLSVTRTAGTGTSGDPTAWTCQIKGVVMSRTGASAPF